MEDGRQLGRYELITRLATGGMAEVWLARSRGIKGFTKTIVLKTILPHFADNPDFVNMFINEALLASLLNHPNVVQIFDLGELDDMYYIAMEFVDGRTLRQVQRALAKAKKITPPWLVLHVSMAVCEALEYAHNKCDDNGEPLNIVHRDVTPENIMISFAGTAKVLDFGIAKASIAASETKAGTLKGKYAYMAPERIVGMKEGEKPDRRSDLYSLGVVLYELLTGKRPFKADNELSLLRQIAEEDPIPPRQRASWVPPRLDEIVLRAMTRDPDLRYQTAADLREDLHEFLISVDSHPTERHVSELLCKLFSADSKNSSIRVVERKPKKTKPAKPKAASGDATTDISSETSETSGPGYYAQMLVEGKSFITGANGGQPIFTRETEEISTSELLLAADREAATVMADSTEGELPSGVVPRPGEPPPLPSDLDDEDTGSAPQETGFGGAAQDEVAEEPAVEPSPDAPADDDPLALALPPMNAVATGPVEMPMAGTTGEVALASSFTGPMPGMPGPSTTGSSVVITGPMQVTLGDTQELERGARSAERGVESEQTLAPEPDPEPEPEEPPQKTSASSAVSAVNQAPDTPPEPEPQPELAISPMDTGDGDFPGLDMGLAGGEPDIESATSGVRHDAPVPVPEAGEPEEAATVPNMARAEGAEVLSPDHQPAQKAEPEEETSSELKDQPSSVWDRPSAVSTGWDLVVERRKRATKAGPPAADGEEPAPPPPDLDPEDQVSVWDTLVSRAKQAQTPDAEEDERWLGKSPRKKRRKKKASDRVATTPEEQAREKFELGLSKVRERDYEAAEAAWNEALELDPDNRVYKGNLKRLQKLKESQ